MQRLRIGSRDMFLTELQAEKVASLMKQGWVIIQRTYSIPGMIDLMKDNYFVWVDKNGGIHYV